jgi:predicted NACHT family NTPase
VFDLSTWADKYSRLQDWLADQLNCSYNIPLESARKLVEESEILPLLDGLDELRKDRRIGCVKAVNTFRRECGLPPLVVTTRTTQYDELTTRLEGLGGTVVVQPLTRSQVESYFDRLESSGATIRGWLDSDPELWELLNTPLMVPELSAAGWSDRRRAT